MQKENQMLSFIDSLDISDSNKKELKGKIETLFDDKSSESSYYTEKYFKNGFSLGVSLIKMSKQKHKCTQWVTCCIK